MDCSMPVFPVLPYLPEFVQIHFHWVGDGIQVISSSVTPFSSCPQSFPGSGSFLMSWLCIRWPSIAACFSIRPSNEYLWLISFRIDWFDFLAVQETLKSLLQDDNLKASILQCPAFFMAQLSHPYMATGKTIALNVWTYVGKMMSLLFNTLSRFITFLPRSKCLLISWLQSLSTVTLEPNKIKPLTVSIFLPIYLPWSYLLLKDQ